jgi:hypothetical protein
MILIIRSVPILPDPMMAALALDAAARLSASRPQHPTTS